ncbi:DUF1043 family protein [Kangiella sp. HD9-110m-PIT-SAG07]|nr:DUF1043 family protein [Kangiella sp. HD9-110m-PIT-SAG07]
MSAVLSIILILIAAVAAFFIGRWHGLSNGTKELTKELESKDKELDELKSGVNEHFDETARLFSNLTEEYKNFYQHLATGASKLSSQEFKVKLSAPVGQDALPSEASAAEVIDAEEHLSKDVRNDLTDNEKSHEEETFVRDEKSKVDDDSNLKEDSSSKNLSKGSTPKESSSEDKDTEETKSSSDDAKPDLDIEVSPPRDWADGDMNDDYHPNDSVAKESEFTDLANENREKPSAPGYEKNEDDKNEGAEKADDKTKKEQSTKA